LVELLVATTIATFVALVSIGTLRAITAGAKIVEDNINAAAEVRFAAKTVKRDLVNMYRPSNVQNTKFIAFADDSGPVGTTYMVFYALNRTKARPQQPEGDVYEVEYYVMADGEKSVLMRRLWPNPDDELEPGGMLTVVADDIDVFQAMFFDGEEWSDEWPEEMQTLPMLIELNIVGRQVGSAQPAVETLYVNLSRSVGSLLEEDEEESSTESG
jgi:type II secretion system protein J